MSNLSSVAVRSRRMSIALDAGEGSRAPHTSEVETSSRSKRIGFTVGAGDGARAPRATEISTSSRGKHTGITLGVTDGSRIKYAEESGKLATPRTIKLIGAVEGQGVFDGSDDLMIYTMGDYGRLANKPEINGEVLDGNKTSEELGLQPAGEYADVPIANSEIDEIIDGETSESNGGDDESAMSEEDINHIIG